MATEDVCFEADSLDDLLVDVLQPLLDDNDFVSASKGDFTEMLGARLTLRNPRARLSRSESKGKIFSALGEFLWYMSGKNSYDFIDYYVPDGYKQETEDGVIVKSGYGDRLFEKYGVNQIGFIIEMLHKKPTSRRAVIQIYAAADMAEKSVPCTCTLQFILRNNRLNLLVYMRSNDAYLGLSHDVFAFTMIQELVARAIGVGLGTYQHFVGSLHLYKRHRDNAAEYISEGWQNEIPMEAMPDGSQMDELNIVRQIECRIREHGDCELTGCSLSSYWNDICILLAIYNKLKTKDYEACKELKLRLSGHYYHAFIDDRLFR